MMTTPIGFELRSYTVPVTFQKTSMPLPGHQAPLDKRHRWSFTRSDTRGHWYRCIVCRKRKRVVDVAMLLARKLRDAERSVDDYLNETLFR